MTEQNDDEYWPGEQIADVEGEIEADAGEDTGEEILVIEELLIIEEREPEPEPEPVAQEPAGHAPGALLIPDGVDIVEGSPQGTRKRIAVVVSRFNGEVTNQLLESALAELDRAGIERENVTVMPVPGAFELPIGAMALAKTPNCPGVMTIVTVCELVEVPSLLAGFGSGVVEVAAARFVKEPPAGAVTVTV